MKKVKLKLTYKQALDYIKLLEEGTIINPSNDFRVVVMTESLVQEVLLKLIMATVFTFSKPKTLSLSVAQAMSLTMVSNPFKNDIYFEHVISQNVLEQIYRQVPNQISLPNS